MNLSKKIKGILVALFVCGMLVSATLTSCNRGDGSGDDAKEESAEHPAGDSTEHPAGENEHPQNDSTDVQD